MMMAIVAAGGLCCNMSFDEYYISVSNWDKYTSLGRMAVRMGRCLSENRMTTGIVAGAIFWLLVKVCKLEAAAADKAAAVIFSVCFSIMQLIGLVYGECGDWNMLFLNGFLTIRSLFHLTGILIPTYCLILFAFKGLDRFLLREEKAAAFTWKKYVIAAGAIFLCWLPYLILFFPGTSNKDTATGIARGSFL